MHTRPGVSLDPMTVLLALDDTDMPGTPGTGRLVCDHRIGPKPVSVQGGPVLVFEEWEDGWRALRHD